MSLGLTASCLVVFAAIVADGSGSAAAPEQQKPASGSSPAAASIGTATMEENGTIVLDLRAEGPGGVRGDARFVYPRGHKQYDEILRHLGGLRRGESKPVPPWPDPAPAARWLETFVAYPGARELCSQHVTGNTMEIAWRAYTTTDATADVVAFYTRTEGKDRVRVAKDSLTVSKGDHVLAVHSASATDYPRCGTSPRPEDKTVIIVSEGSRRR